MSEQTLAVETGLGAKFPEIVAPDTRKGYEGYLG